MVAAIGAEMKRVQDRMDEDAYSLLNGLYTGDDQNQAPWTSRIDGWTADGLSVEFAVTATDPAGTVAATFWDFGDGETGDKDNHTYAQAGTYLAAFTVVDDDGASFTDWSFVTVADPSPAADEGAGTRPALVLHGCVPNPCNPATTISYELSRGSTVDLAIFDASGRCVRHIHDGTYLSAGRHTSIWTGRDDARPPAVQRPLYLPAGHRRRLRDPYADFAEVARGETAARCRCPKKRASRTDGFGTLLVGADALIVGNRSRGRSLTCRAP